MNYFCCRSSNVDVALWELHSIVSSQENLGERLFDSAIEAANSCADSRYYVYKVRYNGGAPITLECQGPAPYCKLGTSTPTVDQVLSLGSEWGDIDLRGAALDMLPTGLDIQGDLDLIGSTVKVLPEDMNVYGTLLIGNTQVVNLPDGFSTEGSLTVYGEDVVSLPKNLHVAGMLCIDGTGIKKLPNGIVVGGSFSAAFSALRSIPDGFSRCYNIDLTCSKVSSLPRMLSVDNDFL